MLPTEDGQTERGCICWCCFSCHCDRGLTEKRDGKPIFAFGFRLFAVVGENVRGATISEHGEKPQASVYQDHHLAHRLKLSADGASHDRSGGEVRVEMTTHRSRQWVEPAKIAVSGLCVPFSDFQRDGATSSRRSETDCFLFATVPAHS